MFHVADVVLSRCISQTLSYCISQTLHNLQVKNLYEVSDSDFEWCYLTPKNHHTKILFLLISVNFQPNELTAFYFDNKVVYPGFITYLDRFQKVYAKFYYNNQLLNDGDTLVIINQSFHVTQILKHMVNNFLFFFFLLCFVFLLLFFRIDWEMKFLGMRYVRCVKVYVWFSYTIIWKTERSLKDPFVKYLHGCWWDKKNHHR